MKPGQIWSTRGYDGKPWGWRIFAVDNNTALIRSIKTGLGYHIVWPEDRASPEGMTLIEDVP